jgi:hypothetical protein
VPFARVNSTVTVDGLLDMFVMAIPV